METVIKFSWKWIMIIDALIQNQLPLLFSNQLYWEQI